MEQEIPNFWKRDSGRAELVKAVLAIAFLSACYLVVFLVAKLAGDLWRWMFQ